MDWLEEVRLKAKRKNQVLFGKDSPLLRDLQLLMDQQNRRVLTLWALELAETSVVDLQKRYPEEIRSAEAVAAARDWAAGRIKMPVARRKILDCHAVAKGLDDAADAALCHAIGQACSVVHTVGHGMGYPMYELTAIVHRLGVDNCREAVEQRVARYIERLLFWQAHEPEYAGPWAKFMMN